MERGTRREREGGGGLPVAHKQRRRPEKAQQQRFRDGQVASKQPQTTTLTALVNTRIRQIENEISFGKYLFVSFKMENNNYYASCINK
jgi:hypothetical protein